MCLRQALAPALKPSFAALPQLLYDVWGDEDDLYFKIGIRA